MLRPQCHIQFATGIGVILGNIVGAIMRSVLTDEELVSWGWRIPFLSGIVIGTVALLIHVHGTEINPNERFYNNSESTINDETSLQTSRLDP